jgi:hypothetical protein
MNHEHDPEAWKYVEKAMSWYGWGSPIGLSFLLVSTALAVYLLHQAGLWR